MQIGTKVAIVLGGGGSKGAYHIGAWRALKKLGIDYHIITGTSIGALNGALMVQGDYKAALKLWQQIDIDKIVLNGLNLRTDLNYYMQNSAKLLPFLKSYKAHKGMDIAPLKALLDSALNKKFFSSSLDYGLVSVKVPSFTPMLMPKSKLNMANLSQWIIASASCFPAFPVCEINNESYIDGGYYDNLPIDFAFKLGAKRVIAIALNPESHIFSNHPLVLTIQPLSTLGGMLDFDSTSIAVNLELGYLDTLKAFGRLWGRAFSFRVNKAFMDKCVMALNALLCNDITRESSANKSNSSLNKAIELLSLPLQSHILNALDKPYPHFSAQNPYKTSNSPFANALYPKAINLIESAMLYFGNFTPQKVHDLPKVCEALRLLSAFKIQANVANLGIYSSEKDIIASCFGTFLHHLKA